MTTQDQVRTQDAWDKIAADFDEYTTPLTIPLAEDALSRVDLRRDMRFLDVAAGSGALSLPAARSGAEVLGTDIAPAMIDRLKRHAREEKLANLNARVMDGQDLDLENNTFDVTGSQNGVSLFPDLQRGLRELVRVTKPGGRVLIVSFGPPPEVEFINFFMGALQAVVPDFDGLPMNPPPLPFQVADPEKLREQMAEAGLKNLRVDTVTWTMEFRSTTHLWDVVTNSNPLGAELISDLTHEQTAEVQQVLGNKLHERSGGSGPSVLTARMNIGIGTKGHTKR